MKWNYALISHQKIFLDAGTPDPDHRLCVRSGLQLSQRSAGSF